MTGAVATFHIVGDAAAIFLYPYGVPYLNGRFIGFRYGAAIPVAAGKYMLKQVNVESGEECIIDNRLRISGQYEIPAASQEECVYWLHRL